MLSLLPFVILPILSSVTPAFAACPESPEPLKIEHITPETTCSHPTQAHDKISVHYRGTLQSDGSQFDASYDRGSPFSFPLGAGHVIKGWDEGLLNMCVGDKRRLIISPEKGYGDRGAGPIPACSTLIFETELMGVSGVPVDQTKGTPVADAVVPSSSSISSSTIITPSPSPVVGESSPTSATASAEATPAEDMKDEPEAYMEDDAGGECRLLGPFALVVQGALGLLALLSLVFKRWRESPRRPMKIFLFDASKQVVGTALLHVVNLAMSMFSSAPTSVDALSAASSEISASGHAPNPCSFYLLNLAIDTTIGIPILVVCLKVLHALFLRTPLANPPESIKSGNYGQPPRVRWWIKQCFIYFLGLFSMKLFVFFLFQALPWLAWVGDWALRWTEGNESLQIAFVMFLFPLAMNAIQYYVIDAFIKDQGGSGNGTQGYQTVQTDDNGDEVDDNEDDPLVATRNGIETGESNPNNVADEERKSLRAPARHTGGDGEGSSSGLSSPPDADAKDAVTR